MLKKHIARYWQKLDDERIQCLLCPRKCILKEGKRGFCFVRQSIAGQLVLTTYGRSSGFAVDPIEKKPLNNFFPGSNILSFGTAGCNLGCQFCQNWDISKVKEMDRLQAFASPEKIVDMAKQRGCLSVAFTYNEPIIFAEYAMDTANICHECGLKTVAVTAGYISPEARKDFFGVMDAVNVDLKSFSDDFYRKYCQANLQPVLDAILYLKHETDVWFELTTLLIPGVNDSDEELNRLTDWIVKNLGVEVPLHFSAFHPAYKMMDRVSTQLSTLKRARHIALAKGINYVYTGNVLDVEGASTWCPSCKELLIERTYYSIGQYHVRASKCEFCGTMIAGRFGD